MWRNKLSSRSLLFGSLLLLAILSPASIPRARAEGGAPVYYPPPGFPGLPQFLDIGEDMNAVDGTYYLSDGSFSIMPLSALVSAVKSAVPAGDFVYEQTVAILNYPTPYKLTLIDLDDPDAEDDGICVFDVSQTPATLISPCHQYLSVTADSLGAPTTLTVTLTDGSTLDQLVFSNAKQPSSRKFIFREVSESGAWGTEVYTYDDSERLEAYVDEYGNPVPFQYDPIQGHLEEIDYPDNEKETFGYNANGAVTDIYQNGGATAVFHLDRDSGGRPLFLTSPDVGAGIAITYNANGSVATEGEVVKDSASSNYLYTEKPTTVSYFTDSQGTPFVTVTDNDLWEKFGYVSRRLYLGGAVTVPLTKSIQDSDGSSLGYAYDTTLQSLLTGVTTSLPSGSTTTVYGYTLQPGELKPGPGFFSDITVDGTPVSHVTWDKFGHAAKVFLTQQASVQSGHPAYEASYDPNTGFLTGEHVGSGGWTNYTYNGKCLYTISRGTSDIAIQTNQNCDPVSYQDEDGIVTTFVYDPKAACGVKGVPTGVSGRGGSVQFAASCSGSSPPTGFSVTSTDPDFPANAMTETTTVDPTSGNIKTQTLTAKNGNSETITFAWGIGTVSVTDVSPDGITEKETVSTSAASVKGYAKTTTNEYIGPNQLLRDVYDPSQSQ